MATKAVSTPNGRKRRSPRIAQVVPVEIAGNGPDGKVFVESTRTCNLSQNGASVISKNPFAIGAPMAIRRAGAQPVRARVVSSKPASEDGTLELGVEFVGDEGYWACEFPAAWQDAYGRGQPEETHPAAAVPAAQSGPARARMNALDDSLEALLRKAETIRAQAESVLAECALQVEAARRQSTVALTAQREALAAEKIAAEQHLAAQAQAAAESVRTQLEELRGAVSQEAAGLEEKLAGLHRRLETRLQAGREEYEQFVGQAGHRAAEMVRQLAAQMEAHRVVVAEMEAQTTAWHQQNAGDLKYLRPELERLVQGARGDMSAAALAAVQDFRQQLPRLGEEATRFFASMLAEHQAAATEWITQSMQAVRANFHDLENRRRTEVAESHRKACEEYNAALQTRLQEARKSGDAVAAALEARLERARNAFAELSDASERKISGLREEVTSAAAQAEKVLHEAGAQQRRELEQNIAGRVKRLEQQAEAFQAAAGQASARVEEASRRSQETSERMERVAEEKREELERLLASLLARYDHRKEALDRILETLQTSRSTARAALDSLRTAAEEHQGRLRGFSSEREAALGSRSLELEQKLRAACVSLESELQQRAAASLEALHRAFAEGVAQGAVDARQKFLALIEEELARSNSRIAELAAVLEQSAHEQNRALEAMATSQAARLEAAGREVQERAAAADDRLARQAAEGAETVKRSIAAAVGAVEDRQAHATATVGEMLAQVQQAGAELARASAEMEKQIRERQRALETHFATLSSTAAEKRASLDSFCAYTDQAKAELAQAVAGLDRRVEEGRSSLLALQRDLQSAWDKRLAGLAPQIQETLKGSMHACEQELAAIEEAAQGVLEARLRALGEQALAAAEKLMAQAGQSSCAELEHLTQNLRREHQAKIQDLSRQLEQAARDQELRHQQSAESAAASLSEDIQQMGRLGIDRVREAHEMLLREIPNRLTEAEVAFRQTLQKMLEQARQDSAAALRALSSQLIAQDELELRRRLYAALQSPTAHNGEGT